MRGIIAPQPLTITKIGPEARVLLRNLFQYYVHDMAEWFAIETQPDGSYFYDLAPAWEEYGVYLAKSGESIAGFALTGSAAEWLGTSVDARDMHEFFVIRRHRRTGVGASFAAHLWNEHPGEWLVRVLEANAPAVLFWRNAITGYTHGACSEEARLVDGRAWRYFRFLSAGP